jgi:hypothetical protein
LVLEEEKAEESEAKEEEVVDEMEDVLLHLTFF